MSSQEKLERWNTLKSLLFQQLFSQLVVVRLVHILGILQVSLSGRRCRLAKNKLDLILQRESDPRPSKGLLAMLEDEEREALGDDSDDDERLSDEEEGDDDEDRERAKAEGNFAEEQKQLDLFLKKFHELILKPCLEQQVLPLISQTVEAELQSLEMKSKLGLQDLTETLDKAFEKIMSALFALDSGTAPESTDLS